MNIRYMDIHDKRARYYLLQDEYSKKIMDHIMKYQNGEIMIDVERDVIIGRLFVWNNIDKKNEGYINSVYIDKDYRGYGFSNKLVEDAVNKYNGYDLCVDKDNRIAINLYKNHGFVIDKSKNDESTYYMILKSRLKTDSVVESSIASSLESFIKYCDNMLIAEESSHHVMNLCYFLSPDNMNNKTLYPRIPNNYFTKNGYEDNITGRVCFAPSIDQAIMALSVKCDGMELYVHIPSSSNYRFVKSSINEVPDSDITEELWSINPIRVTCVGKIKIGEAIGDGIPFKYGNSVAELYKFKWKWIKYLKYSPPYSYWQIVEAYGSNIADRLMDDPVHNFRAQTGIELIHKEPSLQELKRIYQNWKIMPTILKNISDEKSKELFGVTNSENYKILIEEYK